MKRFLLLVMASVFVLSFSVLTMAADETKSEAKPAAAATEAKPAAAATEAKPAAAATEAKPAAATEAKPAAATEAKPAAATEAKPAAAVNLSGKWTSTLVGEVTVEQTGNKIVGTYQYKDDDDVTQDGKFEAVIEGKMVKGKWFERAKVGSGAESRGQMEWKIADDGKLLVGWYLSEGDTEKLDWNLER